MNTRSPLRQSPQGRSASELKKGDSATKEVRSRLLKMIQENERERRREAATQLTQR